MHIPSDIASIFAYCFAITGFILLLPQVNRNLAETINSTKALSSHRYRESVRDNAISIGIALVIVGLITQLVTHLIHFK